MAPGIDDRRLYHHQLGLAPDASDQYRLNDLRIQTLSVLSQMIGVVELGIEVRDLAAGTVLLASDVFERVDKSAVHIKPGASFGAALVLERGSARLVVISSRAAANARMLDLAAGQGGGWCAIREWWPRASTGTPCQTGRQSLQGREPRGLVIRLRAHGDLSVLDKCCYRPAPSATGPSSGHLNLS
jgi:hypothetical protein